MTDAIKIIGEFEIAKLSLVPGDVLVFKTDKHITLEVAKRLRNELTSLVPPGVKAIVLDADLRVELLTKAEIERRLSEAA